METYAWPDRRPEIRWTGISLPYRIFDPAQQRVTHATITGNKRVSEVLSWVKAQQEAVPPKVSAPGKQRSRYTPTGRKRPGRKSWPDKRAVRLAADAAQAKLNQANPPAE